MLGIIPLPFGKPQSQSRRARRVRPAPAPRPDRPAAARSAAMATSPQKSPSVPKSPTPKSPPSRKKDDSFLGKLGGTLARRKKAKEGECGPAAQAARTGNLGPSGLGSGRAGARRGCPTRRGARRRVRALPGNVLAGLCASRGPSSPPCWWSLRRCSAEPGGVRLRHPGPGTRQRLLWAGSWGRVAQGPRRRPALQPARGWHPSVGPRSRRLAFPKFLLKLFWAPSSHFLLFTGL